MIDSGDTTGRESVYTIYEGHEIMFHVSTLLPYTADNKQQVRPSLSKYVALTYYKKYIKLHILIKIIMKYMF